MDKTRRVFYLSAALFCIGAIIISRYLFSPERTLENIREVDAHIAAIQPAWEKFKKENPDAEFATFASYTVHPPQIQLHRPFAELDGHFNQPPPGPAVVKKSS